MCYEKLGRDKESLALKREVYEKRHLYDPYQAFLATNNLVVALKIAGLWGEAKTILRKTMPDVRRELGTHHDLTLCFRSNLAECLLFDAGATRGDVAEAVAIYEDLLPRTRRIYGADHPNWRHVSKILERAREKLASFDT
jgi:hypothetical protein